MGLGIHVVEFGVSTATACEAAAAAGCELGAIVKSLVFVIDERPVLVLVAGDRQAAAKRLAAHLHVSKKKVRLADADTVLRVTGYAVGGVPPVGHAEKLRTLIDASLGRYATVWAAAGAPNAVFPIAYSTLIKITDGETAAFTEEWRK
jgi:Cys-tRNA(Pro) deacylase